MSLKNFKPFKYNGASSLVKLHEKNMRTFLKTWKKAKKINLPLPKSDNPEYKSFDTVLYHVFISSRNFMRWMCDKLNLPDPKIKHAPKPDKIEEKADEYLAHLLERWRLPLSDVPEDKFEPKIYISRWGTPYCIEAMLEHAVMHPIRHGFQLKNIMGKE
jgi:hypothetical protein